MINNPRRIADIFERLIAAVQQLERSLERNNDVIGQILVGDALTLDEAADVWQVCRVTIQKACEKTAARNEPIGIKFLGHWVIGTTRLLDLIEQSDGRPARVEAEERAEKYASWTLRQLRWNQP